MKEFVTSNHAVKGFDSFRVAGERACDVCARDVICSAHSKAHQIREAASSHARSDNRNHGSFSLFHLRGAAPRDHRLRLPPCHSSDPPHYLSPCCGNWTHDLRWSCSHGPASPSQQLRRPPHCWGLRHPRKDWREHCSSINGHVLVQTAVTLQSTTVTKPA